MTPEIRDHIFISYRRDDARGASGRLYDWLRIAFGREHVFRDVHSIGIGKWRDKIDRALACSSVCVAVVGPRWANAENLPRLHRADDMVRHELVSALACSDLLLVPALVEGAELPNTADLPTELRPIFDVWNAHPITEAGWEGDTRRLIEEIAKGTSLPVGPDFDVLLHDVSAARQRFSELEQTSRLQAEQLEAQRRAIDDLTSKLADTSATERPGLAAAFAALALGDSRAAEDAFEREYDAQSRVLESARQTMVEAARNVANLALSRDVAKAVTFYRKALEIEPGHAETLRLLGGALMLHGELSAATSAFSDSLRVAIADKNEWGEMAAQGGLGDVHVQSGDLRSAHAAYAVALGLAERRLARPGQHRVASRPRREPQQDRRRAGGAGRRPGGAGGAPQEPGDRRGAGCGRPDQHRVASRPRREPPQDRRHAGGAGRRPGGAGGLPQEPGDR